MSPAFNPHDRDLWNGLFANVPADWRTSPPSSAMVDCREFLLRSGATSVLDLDLEYGGRSGGSRRASAGGHTAASRSAEVADLHVDQRAVRSGERIVL
jgi:hypothetical protein